MPKVKPLSEWTALAKVLVPLLMLVLGGGGVFTCGEIMIQTDSGELHWHPEDDHE